VQKTQKFYGRKILEITEIILIGWHMLTVWRLWINCCFAGFYGCCCRL